MKAYRFHFSTPFNIFFSVLFLSSIFYFTFPLHDDAPPIAVSTAVVGNPLSDREPVSSPASCAAVFCPQKFFPS